MRAAPAQQLRGRGALRLLEHFALLDRLTSGAGPSGLTRLRQELGCELAELLVGALARSGGRRDAEPT